MAEPLCKRTALDGVIKRDCSIEVIDRTIEVIAALDQSAGKQQRNTHETVAHHERDRRSLFFGEHQKLRRKLSHRIPIERPSVRHPDAIKHNEQEQRLFQGLAQRLGLFDQQVRPLNGRFGFRCGLAFDVKERRDERDLKFVVKGASFGDGDVGLEQIYRDLIELNPHPERLVMEFEPIPDPNLNPLESLDRSKRFVEKISGFRFKYPKVEAL